MGIGSNLAAFSKDRVLQVASDNPELCGLWFEVTTICLGVEQQIFINTDASSGISGKDNGHNRIFIRFTKLDSTECIDVDKQVQYLVRGMSVVSKVAVSLITSSGTFKSDQPVGCPVYYGVPIEFPYKPSTMRLPQPASGG